VLIRDATASDWAEIWPFLSEILAAGETYCWPRDSSETAARGWWMNKPGGRVFVAVDDNGAVLGTAELHPNQPAAGSHVANAGFMVAPAAARRGVGRALATHVIDHATSDGYRAMQFNAVVATNRHAVALWESLGFEILATVPRAFDHPVEGLVGLHVMHRALGDGEAVRSERVRATAG
jgi:L-amino acid N-acyltransferase YncA